MLEFIIAIKPLGFLVTAAKGAAIIMQGVGNEGKARQIIFRVHVQCSGLRLC
jgi:hypothetical protein